MTTSESYGYPYYNKAKPKSYIRQMYESKIKSIETEINKLEFEKGQIQEEMNRVFKIINNHGK